MVSYLLLFMIVTSEALLRGRSPQRNHFPFQIKHNTTFEWLRTNTLLKTKIPLQTQIEKVLQQNKRELYQNIREVEYKVENQLQVLKHKIRRESTWETMFIVAVAWGCITTCILMCLCLGLLIRAKKKKNR
jgi:hypothetical protein